MKTLRFYLTLLSLFLISCNTQQPYSTELRDLKNQYGGDWSISEFKSCILLKVENSNRINKSPDSIRYYTAEIDKLTTNIEPKRCISFEVIKKTGSSMFSVTQSDIYIIRSERKK